MTSLGMQGETAIDLMREPVKWVLDKVQYAVSLVFMAVVLGAALYYTWSPLAGAFSFLQPLDGYWSYCLAALGVYVAWLIWVSAQGGATLDVINRNTRNAALDLMARALIVFVVCWVIVEYLA